MAFQKRVYIAYVFVLTALSTTLFALFLSVTSTAFDNDGHQGRQTESDSLLSFLQTPSLLWNERNQNNSQTDGRTRALSSQNWGRKKQAVTGNEQIRHDNLIYIQDTPLKMKNQPKNPSIRSKKRPASLKDLGIYKENMIYIQNTPLKMKNQPQHPSIRSAQDPVFEEDSFLVPEQYSSLESEQDYDSITTFNTFHDDIPPGAQRKCALLLFGLPRAFRSVVLPSLIKNVLIPNAKYRCDVYAHYYQVDFEKPGRGNAGGKIERDAVQLLRQAVADTIPGAAVHIISDTEEQFWEQRNASVQKYRTTISNVTGRYLYFPWKDTGYVYPSSIDNIAKQWHSINAVFEKMEETMAASCQEGVTNMNMPCTSYDRVAMLRIDVFYAMPVDIYQLDKETDDNRNEYVVMPLFGGHPVNDRLVYGPYQAIKVWATERYRLVEEHVHTYTPGYGMHSERFLNNTIVPLMKQQEGVRGIHANPDICFMRVRPNGVIWQWDCRFGLAGATRGLKDVNTTALIETILERKCTVQALKSGVNPVTCSE